MARQARDLLSISRPIDLLHGSAGFAGIHLPDHGTGSLANKKRPYLAVGWFWYLGTLVPVVGLVHVGDIAHADRYTYVPLVECSSPSCGEPRS